MDTKKACFSFLLLFVFLFGNHSSASDTISAVKGLRYRYGETISSCNGVFRMGFFTPDNSKNHYLSIWYHKNDRKVVWVARKDKPLKGLLDELYISEDGNLVIYDSFDSSIWYVSRVPNISSNTTKAVLGDDGNLVLRDKFNSSAIYWQSFDHSADTWLSGGENWLIKKIVVPVTVSLVAVLMGVVGCMWCLCKRNKQADEISK